MPRPLVATIDVSAMRHNLHVIKAAVPAARVWAVVKANAYGHGLERAMRGFSAANGLALIEPEAAASLRELGWKKPILLLEGFFDETDARLAEKCQLQVTVHCQEQISLLEKLSLKSKIDVHLKMNSGMNRLGFTPESYRQAYLRLRSIPCIGNIALITHFANADDADNPGLSLWTQINRFQQATAGIDAECSLSNSAATLLHPEIPNDWVRPGIALYGGSPGGKSAKELGLQPVMTLTSEIIDIQSLRPADVVGYGSRFATENPLVVGVVAGGYADGYPRHAPDGTPVLVDGFKTRMIGRISMDMMTVDLTGIPTARVGSKVTLWGEGLPIDDVANAAGTVGYELMCALAPRVAVVER